MMHPALSLTVWAFILCVTASEIATGQAWSKWGVFTREDHPIRYWMRVLAGAAIVIIFPLFCLPDWIALVRTPGPGIALFTLGR
jgi:hypothetical protein